MVKRGLIFTAGILLAAILGLFIYKMVNQEGSVRMDKGGLSAIVKGDERTKFSALPAPKLSERQIGKIALLENHGFISFEMSAHKVYIKPAFWAQMDSKLKADMTVSFAIYCAIKNSSEVIQIDVFDKLSGRKIAAYNQLVGYKAL